MSWCTDIAWAQSGMWSSTTVSYTHLDVYKRQAVGLKIPVIKHITTKLISSLEEHLREDPGNKGTTFSQDDKTQVQNDLDKVRQQRIALENQIKHQSILQTQQTGYNPFASTPMTLQSPQFDNMPSQVANTSNPFQQYQSLQPQMTQPQMIQAPTLDPQMTCLLYTSRCV